MAGPPPEADEDLAARRARRRRWVRGLASVALGWALLVGVLPRLADLAQVWDAVKGMTAAAILGLIVVSAWNILTYQFEMMAALPGLSWRDAFLTGQMATAVTNTVPAGALLGIGVIYAVLASFGHRTADIARAAVLTGWWTVLVKFALPVAALLLLAVQGASVNQALLSAAIVGLVLLTAAIAVLVAAASSDRLARLSGRIAQRAVNLTRRPFGAALVHDWEDRAVEFRCRSAGLLRRRWALLTLTTTVSQISLFWVLLASLRATGVGPEQVTWQEALGAFAFVTLATALPLTPGGFGLIEVGMAAALVLAGGDEPRVVAAVLVYRALTYLLQVGLGAGSYLIWRWEMRRHHHRETEGAAGGKPAAPDSDDQTIR
jgi:uncharacterized protein (TIRG00374 family)